jgi:hypothetical protein
LRHLDGFAVFKKAALQLSIREIREIRGHPKERRKPFPFLIFVFPKSND